ncbi:hypothetical protein M9H77_23382 [Catharanthus roseus]|uniref:Uncharacterized protein n=1 Tax=Catharanthus roseus TaxID=4058 RepID=A0ACC0AT41_CATRO|nr:hypothetical protein M9H77_23382 [Catharanthus roseus]
MEINVNIFFSPLHEYEGHKGTSTQRWQIGDLLRVSKDTFAFGDMYSDLSEVDMNEEEEGQFLRRMGNPIKNTSYRSLSYPNPNKIIPNKIRIQIQITFMSIDKGHQIWENSPKQGIMIISEFFLHASKWILGILFNWLKIMDVHRRGGNLQSPALHDDPTGTLESGHFNHNIFSLPQESPEMVKEMKSFKNKSKEQEKGELRSIDTGIIKNK